MMGYPFGNLDDANQDKHIMGSTFVDDDGQL